MSSIIKVEGISKSYDISHQQKTKYHTIKDDVVRVLKKPLGGGGTREDHETFWALDDVSFEVNQGEIFGVVGKNGSGKSTLLKILSRIVDPTKGRVEMHGRVASLLEVGTGFHPELTGRENVYFNGSMIGMSRQEIKKRFNEIVEFSEVEKFLDTPVKYYSSGMYVRLAFAVAAHLEPDILILDEVLAVGDSAFQKKSFNKIISTMQSGCTVIIVSHGAENLRKLCKQGILLQDGHIASTGKIDKVLMDYSNAQIAQLPPTSTILREVMIRGTHVKNWDNLKTDSPFTAEVEFVIKEDLPNCQVNFYVEDSAGKGVFHKKISLKESKKGTYKIAIELPRLSLNTGSFSTWFKIAATKEFGEYTADSSREVIDVTGVDEEPYSNVDINASWSVHEPKSK